MCVYTPGKPLRVPHPLHLSISSGILTTQYHLLSESELIGSLIKLVAVKLGGVIHVGFRPIFLPIEEGGEYYRYCYYCYRQQLALANQISTHGRTNSSERYDGHNNYCELDLDSTADDHVYSFSA